MHRRFLFPLAAGIVGLLAFSPVLAAQPSPAAEQGPAKATTTTAPADDSGAADPSDSDPGSADPDSTDPDSTDPDSTGPDSAGPDSSSTTASTGKGGSSTTATTGKGGSSATTAPGSGSGSSTDCGQPDTVRSPAPQVGDDPQAHEAGEAGTVEVERLSQTELRIAKATANDGWTQQVTAPSGPRVNVRFTRPGQSPSLIRFAASMDQAGQEIHVRVTTCG
jgi:hypothetical protein